ncbi:26S proteasome-associated Mov34/MPN/PAD1-like and JAB domain-containing protein [Cryptosporidium canis]|uniref:26S proteasome-associated Mov34/MPN/PAD1-like and JAB domain-containing protein n=1 Tax=Cryptosporidium canis TaxID=195482 RepID=A0ABQ8P628_9CRYT|nr:26S proteasome-associated Mov34/MPN/PAD1-like and JAB domain-containing protein [Cryptosporidium canis]
MLKHGRAGVPMEVMGLLLGEFIDDYSVRVVDVFSMPQSGNSVSVEAVDPVYQTDMLEMLKRVGRSELVVGWYHSHPGFGCWFSGTDVSTQQSFEQLNPRAVGIVVDPIQSVKGKVVIDCFRLISPQSVIAGQEPRQTTSNIGHLQKPSITALVHGLNRNYYSIAIRYRKNLLEQKMLLNLHKPVWSEPLKCDKEESFNEKTNKTIKRICETSKQYHESIKLELTKTSKELELENVGKIDAKKRLNADVETVLTDNILEILKSNIASSVF